MGIQSPKLQLKSAHKKFDVSEGLKSTQTEKWRTSVGVVRPPARGLLHVLPPARIHPPRIHPGLWQPIVVDVREHRLLLGGICEAHPAARSRDRKLAFLFERQAQRGA